MNGDRVRVLLSNALTSNPHHDLIVNQIRASDPDLIVILELSNSLARTLQQEFASQHPYAIFEPQDTGNFGIGLWSRLPLTNAQIFTLNLDSIPSIAADIQIANQPVHVVATHPLPSIGSRYFAFRNEHLLQLSKRLKSQGTQIPKLVFGDLNLTPWSPIFHDFLAETGLKNAAAGRGLQPTWNRWPAFPFGLLLDHGLHSESLPCTSRTILPTNGSDHRAVVFEFLAHSHIK